MGIDKLMLKFTWEWTEPRTAKTTLQKNNEITRQEACCVAAAAGMQLAGPWDPTGATQLCPADFRRDQEGGAVERDRLSKSGPRPKSRILLKT